MTIQQEIILKLYCNKGDCSVVSMYDCLHTCIVGCSKSAGEMDNITRLYRIYKLFFELFPTEAERFDILL